MLKIKRHERLVSGDRIGSCERKPFVHVEVDTFVGDVKRSFCTIEANSATLNSDLKAQCAFVKKYISLENGNCSQNGPNLDADNQRKL